MENKKNILARWANKKYVPGATKLMFYICIASFGCLYWVRERMDNDSYYMIAQGLDMLKNGIPEYNPFLYHHGAKIVVQQWVYCLGITFANMMPKNTGLMLFMCAQAMAVLWLMERFLRKATNDLFWTHLGAAIALLVTYLSYAFTLRPENVTIMLMLLQCMALERYRETKKKRFLAALPAIMLLEANLHIAMWPAHVCIYLAYLVPSAFPWLQGRLQEKGTLKIDICPGMVEPDGLRPDPWLYGASALSILCVLVNPYGMDGALYLFRSMPVFSIIGMLEQTPPILISELAMTDILFFGMLALLIKIKAIKATEACLAAGFTALACTNYHNSRFLPIAAISLFRPMLRMLSKKGAAHAKDLMPNGLKAFLYAGTIISIAATYLYTIPQLQLFKEHPHMDAAIQYIADNQAPGGNVLNNLNSGPMLEHAGITGIYGDTRPELLMESICDTHMIAEEVAWFCNGQMTENVRNHYNSLEDYMEKNSIQFIMDTQDKPDMVYLLGWLENNDAWELHTFAKEGDGTMELERGRRTVYLYSVWERKDFNTDDEVDAE